MTHTEPETTKMTSNEVLKIRAIAAMIEASDQDDEDDAKQLIKMIKALLGADKQP